MLKHKHVGIVGKFRNASVILHMCNSQAAVVFGIYILKNIIFSILSEYRSILISYLWSLSIALKSRKS